MSDIFDFEVGDTYYSVIGVSSNASTEEIKRQWRQKIKIAQSNQSVPEKKYEYLLDAGEVLGNLEKRKLYNELDHETFIANHGRRGKGIRDETPQSRKGSDAVAGASASVDYSHYDPSSRKADEYARIQGGTVTKEKRPPHWRYEEGTKTERRAKNTVTYTPPKKITTPFVSRPVSTRVSVVSGLVGLFIVYASINGLLSTGRGLMFLLILTPGTLLLTRGVESYSRYVYELSRTYDHSEDVKTKQRFFPKTLLWVTFLSFIVGLILTETSVYSLKQTVITSFDATIVISMVLAAGGIVFGMCGLIGVVLGKITGVNSHSKLHMIVFSTIIGGVIGLVFLSLPEFGGRTVFLSQTGANELPWQIGAGSLVFGINSSVFISFSFAIVVSLSFTVGLLLSIPCVMATAHHHIVQDDYIIPGVWETLITIPVIVFLWTLFVLYTTNGNVDGIQTTLTTEMGVSALALGVVTALLMFLIRSHIEPQYSEWRESQVSGDYQSRR